MKKGLFTIMIIICLLPFSLLSQKKLLDVPITEIENKKSANLKDVFSSFYQLAFKNLTEKENAVEFNSTLFAAVKSYDSDIVKTRSRAGITFLRNFQFNGKINLNDKYKLNGYSGGFTYAAWNKRDKTFIDITGLPIAIMGDSLARLTIKVSPKMIDILEESKGRELTSNEKKALNRAVTSITSALLKNQKVSPELEELYAFYEEELDKEVKSSEYFKALKKINPRIVLSTNGVVDFIKTNMNDYFKNLENKPLLTFSVDGTSNTGGKINRGSLGTVFLVGGKIGELDARIKFSYIDTLAISAPRSVLNSKLGFNLKIIKGKDDESFFEIKTYFEYNKLFNNLLPDEIEENTFMNTDFRFRLTKDFWIPLTIKYDTKKANFLGFLNVTYNFGS